MLQEFFNQYGTITSADLDSVSSIARKVTFKKGNFLLAEGGTCSNFHIVISGCVRLYFLNDDLDISVWFSFGGNSAIELHSYINQSSSEYFLECIEDTQVLSIPKAQLDSLCESNGAIDKLLRLYWQDVVQMLIGRMTSLQKYSAEERYLQLLADTDYLNRIPQKYLASYIGVTPTSLSRIRRQVASKA